MVNEIEIIENAFNNIEKINSNSDKEILDAINNVIEKIDNGSLRVADKNQNDWTGYNSNFPGYICVLGK